MQTWAYTNIKTIQKMANAMIVSKLSIIDINEHFFFWCMHGKYHYLTFPKHIQCEQTQKLGEFFM